MPPVDAPLTKPTDVERPQRAVVARIESEGGIEFDPERASFGTRFIGLVIDGIVTLIFLLPGVALVMIGAPVALGVMAMVVGFVAATVVYARSVSATGQWVGNRMTTTRVVDARHGKNVTAGEAGLRFVLRATVSSVLLIGFLVALADSQRRTFHDKFAGTVVTRPPRASWSIDDEATGGRAA